MNSRDYWKKREDEARKNTIRDEQEYNRRLNEIYQYMIANIERQVNNWYANYASKEGITMAEARGRVKHIDMERYERLAAKYVATHDFSDQANEEMALYNLTMKVNRLELLKAEINLELMAGFDDIEHEMRRDLIETAMKEDRRLAGILGDSAIGNEQYAKELVNASFRNATFSERIWGRNMPDLRIHLEAELRNGIIQGIGSKELARRFRKHYGGSIRDTERLMTTEMCRLQTAVQKESFERNGYKEYMFITSGDETVCSVCQALHGQHFKVSEMQAGENAPPLHPRCHCSAASYMDSDKYKRWIDALANGEDVRWNEFEAGIGGEKNEAHADNTSPDAVVYSMNNPHIHNSEEVVNKYYGKIRFETENEVIKKSVEECIKHIPERDLEILSEHRIIIREGKKHSFLSKPITAGKTEYHVITINPNDQRPFVFAHEFAHLAQEVNNLQYDSEFNKLLVNYLKSGTGFMYIPTEKGFDLVLCSPKSVELYQGRTYIPEDPLRATEINAEDLIEYISVGYEVYIGDETVLEKKDPELYNYFERRGLR